MAEKLLRNGIRHRLQLYSEIKITPDKRFLTKRKKTQFQKTTLNSM